MIESILTPLAPMLLGAQIILMLVLTKGDICPGQRGRVHKLMPAIGVLWLAITTVNIGAFVIASCIFYFFSQVQTTKTRTLGPLWALYLAIALAVVFVGFQLTQFSSFTSYLSWGIVCVLLGGSFANLMLLIARSRLDAFHKLLPTVGIISGILLSILIAVQVMGQTDAALAAIQYKVFTGLFLLVAGLLVWSAHLITRKKVHKLPLSIALVCLLTSTVCLLPVFSLTAA